MWTRIVHDESFKVSNLVVLTRKQIGIEIHFLANSETLSIEFRSSTPPFILLSDKMNPYAIMPLRHEST